MSIMALVAHTAQFFLALVFLAAGVVKVGNRREFAIAVDNYQVVPRVVAPVVARWLPPGEVLLGLLLLAGIAPAWVGALATVLLVVFILVVVVNLLRGRRVECGCFGTSVPRRITWWTVLRNLSLLVMAGIVTVGAPPGLTTWTWSGTTSPAVAVAAVIPTLLTAVALFMVVSAVASGIALNRTVHDTFAIPVSKG